MRDPEEIYVALSLGTIGPEEVIAWSYEALQGSLAADDFVCEIAGLNFHQRYEAERVVVLLETLVGRREFVINSERGALLAQSVLRETCKRYLAGEIEPFGLCRLVFPIEQMFDYPAWLGDLYNACDWVEPATRSAEVPHLADEAQALIRQLSEV